MTEIQTNQPNSDEKDETVEAVEEAQTAELDTLLTPAEVSALFRVSPKTVSRWAKSGKIAAIRTLGGHRRFRASQVKAAIEAMTE